MRKRLGGLMLIVPIAIVAVLISGLAAWALYNNASSLVSYTLRNDNHQYKLKYLKNATERNIEQTAFLGKDTKPESATVFGIKPVTDLGQISNCQENILFTVSSNAAKGYNVCNAGGKNVLYALNFQKDGVWHTAAMFNFETASPGQLNYGQIDLNMGQVKQIFNSIEVSK